MPPSGRERRPLTAFRIFRPPLPVKVDLRDGYPARVAFTGRRANVMAASGPWRTSGDWWREETWQQDEWDLELSFEPARNSNHTKLPERGIYCIYFDSIRQGWFARGMYD
jgi:hypothetical protein